MSHRRDDRHGQPAFCRIKQVFRYKVKQPAAADVDGWAVVGVEDRGLARQVSRRHLLGVGVVGLV